MSAPANMFPEVQLAPEADPNERYTPWPFFRELNAEFRFTLDVCATAESAKCERYFTKADDGLQKRWFGENVWCNPPFDNIGDWVRKAWIADAELVVMLVPAWTDRAWWQGLVEPYRDGRNPRFTPNWKLTARFLKRVRFGFPGNPNGVGVDSPPFWPALLIWRTT